MTAPTSSQNAGGTVRALIVSMFFAPCREVGGKRFSYLSNYLSREFAAYHVLARRERVAHDDRTAFRGNVHRTGMMPYFPSRHERGIWKKASRLWAQWFCQIDPYIGWVIPATVRGIRLCRRHSLNVVVVTVPAFSSIIAAVLVSKAAGCKLIVDYRDEWTNHVARFRRPFGKYICPMLERIAIKQASAAVFCTDVMRQDFVRTFGDIAPGQLEVIYNGYEEFNDDCVTRSWKVDTNMVFAGNFYGKRQISIIAPALAAFLDSGVISAETFRLHLYSRLKPDHYAVIERSGIGHIIEVHDPVPYDTIRQIMRSSDILFLPSGEDVKYAVPFKFFDYLSARRPILAVAPRKSALHGLMKTIDCGAFAEIGNKQEIVLALKSLLQEKREFTFHGAEQFKWSHAAAQYSDLANRIVNQRQLQGAPAND